MFLILKFAIKHNIFLAYHIITKIFGTILVCILPMEIKYKDKVNVTPNGCQIKCVKKNATIRTQPPITSLIPFHPFLLPPLSVWLLLLPSFLILISSFLLIILLLLLLITLMVEMIIIITFLQPHFLQRHFPTTTPLQYLHLII